VFLYENGKHDLVKDSLYHYYYGIGSLGHCIRNDLCLIAE